MYVLHCISCHKISYNLSLFYKVNKHAYPVILRIVMLCKNYAL